MIGDLMCEDHAWCEACGRPLRAEDDYGITEDGVYLHSTCLPAASAEATPPPAAAPSAADPSAKR
jgi:hypothetical protein